MNRISRFLFLSAIFGGTLLSQRAVCEGQLEPTVLVEPETASSVAQDDPVYAQGTKAMDEQRWADAVSAFDKVAAKANGKSADAALYWKAYSLDKLNRTAESRATCEALRHKEPSSSWNRECMVLRVRTGRANEGIADVTVQMATLNRDMEHMKIDLGPGFEGRDGFNFLYSKNHATTEDDIRILALNSLMREEPAKALPLLRDMLRSDKSVEVKRQALFVLSRSKDPQAQTIVTEVATTNGDPKVQMAAIEILAIGRGKDAGPSLAQVYRSSSDAGVKRAALNGLFIAHDAQHLVELARAEKDLNLKRDIVSQLALMKDPVATDYMLELLK